jgi:predicted metalloprotease with PDZ domain
MMKLFVAGCAALVLVGCATQVRPPATNTATLAMNGAMSYQELVQYPVTSTECDNINWHVANINHQLDLRGLTNVRPESLSEPDRLYNVRARNIIWSYRIACSNPNRYNK